MSIKEPKMHTLKATKTFGDIKKGKTFKAIILHAFVRDMIEGATLRMENGDELNVPYDWFVFVDTDKEKKTKEKPSED